MAHPNGWIISDWHYHNPKHILHTWIKRLCRVPVPWTSWQIWMKQWKRLKISTVIFSLCRSTDYTQHLVCVPVSAQLKSPGSDPGTAMDPWCFQRAPSPAHRAQQGTVWRHSLPSLHTPAWSPSLHPVLSSNPAEIIRPFNSTHVEHPNFLHLWLSLLFVFKPWKVPGTWSPSQVTRLNMV